MVRHCPASAYAFGDPIVPLGAPAVVSGAIERKRESLRRVSPAEAEVARFQHSSHEFVAAPPMPHPSITRAGMAHEEIDRPHVGTGFGNCVEDM
jgi:hypothetical protein